VTAETLLAAARAANDGRQAALALAAETPSA